MESEYDRKFEEMKKYIPFLESLIKRLESTGPSTNNPRQAQLDKIRSLRVLLSDKNKRMKMDNLLKCEQVLTNLYAKVEQRDGFPDIKLFGDSTDKKQEQSDLETVRNKLKTVTKLRPETLPEIARASEIEAICTPGSKEPALFQRRPYKSSPERRTSSEDSKSKRGYTRVLRSPDGSPQRCSSDATSENVLFSRRSPRRSPKRSPRTRSPSRKERKKSSKEHKNRKSKGLNITLNVPEESLSSLNTKDILSRIINCSDGDVDIDTLRELRSKILGELKQTGATDDISELILKSYGNKVAKKNKKQDIEEGELSDSESEAIDSIYGNLVVLDKDKNSSSETKSTEDSSSQRKIQIRLVINPDQDEVNKDAQKSDEKDNVPELNVEDKAENKDVITIDSDTSPVKNTKPNEIKDVDTIKKTLGLESAKVPKDKADVITIDDDESEIATATKSKVPVSNQTPTIVLDSPPKFKSPSKISQSPTKTNNFVVVNDDNDFLPTLKQLDEIDRNTGNDFVPTLKQLDEMEKNTEKVKHSANFYKPLEPEEKPDDTNATTSNVQESRTESSTENSTQKETVESNKPEVISNEPVIPDKPKPKEVSEIEILQALKNEILSETIPIASPEIDTPALHQPKITKVASAQELIPKKRISIAKYKEKSSATPKPLFVSHKNSDSKDNKLKPTKIKLTEKECERFNVPARLSIDDELSDDDLLCDNGPISPTDVYSDLAPMSPDIENTGVDKAPPVIIPVEPVNPTKAAVSRPNSDIDLRPAAPPILVPPPAVFNVLTPPVNIDPRVRKDMSQPAMESPNSYISAKPDLTQKPVHFPNIPPLLGHLTPSYTPSYTPIMTPMGTPNSRSYDITPTHQSYDDISQRKHVYAPTFYENNERESVAREISSDDRRQYRDDRTRTLQLLQGDNIHYKHDKYGKSSNTERREYSKPDAPLTPIPSFGWSDCPTTPSNTFGRQEVPTTPSHPFGRMDCPATPIHHFGRSDCPTTPSHPFGRSDCPTTPSHPFGRSDCPTTPSHPFGRSDCPTTPSHPFGRSDCPTTPSHPFGRSEAPRTPSHYFGRNDTPVTPSHPFGRSDARPEIPKTQSFNKDPRLNRRQSEYSSSPNNDDSNDRFKNDRYSNRASHYNDSSSTRNLEKDAKKGDRYDSSEKSYNRDRYDRRAHSVLKDSEENRLYTRNRGGGYDSRDDRSYEESSRRQRREGSVGKSMQEERYRSTTRHPSVGRSYSERNDKQLSVKPDTGRSYTIDTSVNTSFQNLIESKGLQIFDYSFDARRKRASSVGRSLTRETSVGRTVKTNENPQDKSDRYKRASSVGRELSKSDNRSFKDIKSEFEIFKSKLNWKNTQPNTYKKSNEIPQSNRSRSRNDSFERKKSLPSEKLKPYSPRQNSRDPRMRREHDSRHRGSYSDYRDRRQSGIVYSNDNIAKGAIMGASFGVKNYKIPKIKRVDSEESNKSDTKVETIDNKEQAKGNKKESSEKKLENKYSTEKEKSNSKTLPKDSGSLKKPEKDKILTKDRKDKYSAVENKSAKEKGSDEECDKRITRSSRKSETASTEDKLTNKTKRNRRAVIYDSDSDTDSKTSSKSNESKKTKTQSPKKTKKVVSPAKKFTNSSPIDENLFDPSFAMDDLEMFPDNMVSDPVIQNINEIIADLDNDLDPNEEVSDAEFAKIMSAIDGPDENTLGDISDVIAKDLNESVKPQTEEPINVTNGTDKTKTTEESPKVLDKPEIASEQNNSENTDNAPDLKVSEPAKNEAIVSTSEEDKLLDEKSKNLDVEKANTNESDSIPDSTINKNECSMSDNIVPDSTIQIHNELSSDVTSTHDIETKDSYDTKKGEEGEASKLDTIGNLLSILQDKSKLKEILSMLGEKSGETEKIKKTLEKLSEFVSNEENDETTKETIENENKQDKSGDVIVTENTENAKQDELKKPEENVETPEVEAKTDQNRDEDPTIEAQDDDSKLESTVNEVNVNEDSVDLGDNETHDIPDAEPMHDEEEDEQPLLKMRAVSKKKVIKKSKGKIKKLPQRKAKVATKPPAAKPKPKNRELQKLHEDIKEMFMSDDILNANGIRMCRLAKMVEEKNQNKKDEQTQDAGPVVVLEKCNNIEETQEVKLRKKPGPKPKPKGKPTEKPKNDSTSESKATEKPKPYKPGPKSKQKRDADPYEFNNDSVADNNTTHESEDSESDSDESLASSHSFGSNELLTDIKKKKRKTRGWQSGFIRPKNKKKKEQKDESSDVSIEQPAPIPCIPDFNCFTDKNYCFKKNKTTYGCRLCFYSGDDIVNHYKKQHPHTEIPLSRMDPKTAINSIRQCEEINFQAIIKMPSKKYTCIFCNKEFSKCKTALELFFWHIVSNHTGEYKQTCSMCVTATRCPFNLDIPPPPKDVRGQLIGYICGKCNFTQISLENLKTHVIVRHNDEQTEVFTINLALMSNKTMKNMLKNVEPTTSEPRVLRSRRSIQSADGSDERSTVTDSHDGDDDEEKLPKPEKSMSSPLRSKITFENDEQEPSEDTSVKIEPEDKETGRDVFPVTFEETNLRSPTIEPKRANTDQMVDCDHFKLHFNKSGAKEYVCCINGVNNHYKTSLLISMKKHIQTKHTDNWDGYCSICKVIVTLQGVKSTFRDCLEHYLDKHIDDFPVMETSVVSAPTPPPATEVNRVETPKPYIAVRPLAELIAKEAQNDVNQEEVSQFPKIENIISLGETNEPPARHGYPNTTPEVSVPQEPFKYEEVQAEIMSKKHRVVLDAMLIKDVIVRVYKCAGTYCSFTTDSADEALLHASTHQRVGGEGALRCAYCNFDCSGNAIDLVMHVFKMHGHCRFSCGQCFYRAAASQSVGAHSAKAHGGKDIIIYQSNNIVSQPDNDEVLTREAAVPTYVCYHGKGTCKFQSFIGAKLIDHIEQKHSSETSHPCYLCEATWPNPNDLVTHMVSHGFKMYQCTWCVFGVSNETELLSHVATLHPNRQPQAYVRVINKVTDKDGTTQLRMLPLAYLNKSNIPIENVTPSTSKDNAVREAERSIELEKLISHTNSLVNTEPPVSNQNIEEIIVPVKTEITEPANSNVLPDVIYCLDSDDEGTPANETSSIDNVDNDPPQPDENLQKENRLRQRPTVTEPNMVPKKDLLKCPFCVFNVYASKQGLFRHMSSCAKKADGPISCPHAPCIAVFPYREDLVAHYKVHESTQERNIIGQCGLCNITFNSIAMTKKHLRVLHKANKLVSTARVWEDGTNCFVIKPQVGGPASKQKSSTEAPNIQKYGLNDINKLPITPIFDNPVYCELCEFSTKVRLNLIRHLHLHAEKQSVPQSEPVNPVPHLETNEKHFDKMVNLASSSVVTRGPEKQASSGQTTVSMVIPVEAASRYPKYVPERQRLACGALGCNYISLDEAMLRFHWETLHSNEKVYHCVHCPPCQQIDTSRPLTAKRILSHLKMHDKALYACSSCTYYHHERSCLEKHLSEFHKGGKVVVVREEYNATPVSQSPTMDLKPWQCGLCEFKTMLRPEIVDHCFKKHQSKMQYKCGYCPFRTSAIENVIKHQTNAHSGKAEDIFYYFYKEGSVPNEAEPIWIKQRQKMSLDTEVKEDPESAPETVVASKSVIDLNLVKQEIDDSSEMSLEELCKKYGQFCEPNGIKYKCCLCNVVTEHTRDNMKSHLYEELKYRRWSCGVCTYKAYHRSGLNEHLTAEHSRSTALPTELPADPNIEKWVSSLLDYQDNLIQKNKENFAKQKIQIENTSTSTKVVELPKSSGTTSTTELEQEFGNFGTPNNGQYQCPKCTYSVKDENEMRNHLENELTKIRWCCSQCSSKFQSYHAALLHCKTDHAGQSANPVEALRDPTIRCAWITAVIDHQTQTMTSANIEITPTEQPNPENSLLVVRYEEETQTEESRKRPLDADNEGPSAKKGRECLFCNFYTNNNKGLKWHVLTKHYNYRPVRCSFCGFNSYKQAVINHIQRAHPLSNASAVAAEIPTGFPTVGILEEKRKKILAVCLTCELALTMDDAMSHKHNDITPDFSYVGEVVVKCRKCLVLKSSLHYMQEHYKLWHPKESISYMYYRLETPPSELYYCKHCTQSFPNKAVITAHHVSCHISLPFEFEIRKNEVTTGCKRKNEDDSDTFQVKRMAKKSTAKLPYRTVAKKSTTKLPYNICEEYSFYGTKCEPLDTYKNVTVSMPMCNTIVDIKIEKLKDIIKIDPIVLVKKV